MFASIVLPIAGFVILLFIVPQSPRWLASRNRDVEALAILTRIDGPEMARKQMEEIRESLKEGSSSLGELLQPGIRLALLTGILLAVFNNWTGWSGVAYYLPYLFQMAGFLEKSDAILATLIPMIATVFLTLLSIWLVDRVGRKPLWTWTSALMAVCLTLMGLVFHYQVKGWIVILMVLVIAAPHAVGLGPLPWLMMSELYPTHIRARDVSISTTFLWMAGFSGPLAFPVLVETSKRTIGSAAGVFWMYACVCIFSFIFGLKLLPETKGRTLENIAKSWEKRK
jgi:SP family arabinose:H+ symporter-like MFS transporter